jgi:hypothetical protein
MLTPRSNDENRANELKRKKKEPMTFGSTPATQRLAKGWAPTGLVSVGGEPLNEDPRKGLKE